MKIIYQKLRLLSPPATPQQPSAALSRTGVRLSGPVSLLCKLEATYTQ